MDPWNHTPRHIIITLPKIKDKQRILKTARGKETVNYKGVPIKLSADFTKEILQARRVWKEVFKVMKGKGLHPRLLYPAKLSFRMEGQIKCSPDKVRLKEFILTKSLLHRWQTQVPQAESSPPPCFLWPGTLFLPSSRDELSLNC